MCHIRMFISKLFDFEVKIQWSEMMPCFICFKMTHQYTNKKEKKNRKILVQKTSLKTNTVRWKDEAKCWAMHCLFGFKIMLDVIISLHQRQFLDCPEPTCMKRRTTNIPLHRQKIFIRFPVLNFVMQKQELYYKIIWLDLQVR